MTIKSGIKHYFDSEYKQKKFYIFFTLDPKLNDINITINSNTLH